MRFIKGSETSEAAAKANHVYSGTQRQKVFDYICINGGATDLEIEVGLGMKGSTVRPRRIELEELGMIYKTDEVRGKASVYKLIDPTQTTVPKLPKKLSQAKALRAALKKYGQHLDDCEKWFVHPGDLMPRGPCPAHSCTCGFDAALDA